MLEETLSNSSKTHPADAALAILFFIRQELPLGGVAAEARFIRIFPILMEKVFGSLQLVDINTQLETDNTVPPFHHHGGGWMNRDRWLVRNSSLNKSSTVSSSDIASSQGSHDNADPIVELLCGYRVTLNPQHGLGNPTRVKDDGSQNLLDILEDFVQRKHVIHIGLPFGLLPRVTQINFLSILLERVFAEPKSLLDYGAHGSHMSSFNKALVEFERVNAKTLIAHSLSITPKDQVELINGFKNFILPLLGGLGNMNPSLRFCTGGGSFSSPKPFSTPSTLQSPLSAIQPRSITTPGGAALALTSTSQGYNPTNSEVQMKPLQSLKVAVNMLEYYLFLFIRFPLSSPPFGTPPKDDSSSKLSEPPSLGGEYTRSPLVTPSLTSFDSYASTGTRQPYGEVVYNQCFKAYLHRYMNHEYDDSNNLGKVESHSMDRKTELFVRLIIELWLDREYVFPSTQDVFYGVTPSILTPGQRKFNPESVGLEQSYRLAALSSRELPVAFTTTKATAPVGRYDPLPINVQTCLRSFVQHVMSDPRIAFYYNNNSKLNKSLSMETSWSPPSVHAILQPSLFNYIRVGLRYAPVHESNSSFFSILNLWLLWIEPWNVSHRKRAPTNDFLQGSANAKPHHHTNMQTVVDIPKPSDASKYSSTWEKYVAANVHFYTVPLSIFLRRARELDFSTRDFDRSLDCIRKVFRVYSPMLVGTLQNLLDYSSDSSNSFVLQHEALLGNVCPRLNNNPIELKSCQDDMHNLLEEILLQYNRNMGEEDVLDRIGSWFGLIDRKPSSTVEKLIEQGKFLVGFPLDYEVIPSRKRDDQRKIDQSLNLSPERAADTQLTQTGREQLVSGARLCNALNVMTLGDPMYCRPKSFEIPILVHLTIKLSEKLNNYLGLCKCHDGAAAINKTSVLRMIEQRKEYNETVFRFNFRFLADYRNCLFILFLGFLIKLW